MSRKIGIWIMAIGFIPIVLLSCASIIGKGAPETLNIRSAPDQADVSISDQAGAKIFTGKTPTNVTLEKKKGYFSGKKYTVTIVKPGFTGQTVTVDTNVNGWYIGGNLIFGGLIGWFIVDPLTGAMWSLDTKEINVTMQPVTEPPKEPAKEPGKEPVVEPAKEPGKESSLNEQINFNVVLLQDVPVSLRPYMVKIAQ